MVGICEIQASCYEAQYLEQSAAFFSKISKTSATCWVACLNKQVIAYLICLPVNTATFPVLNASDFELCQHPSLLYLHDLAVHPQYRALGAGLQLINHALNYAKQHQYQQLGLISVQDAESYWQKHGFKSSCATLHQLEDKLTSFGADAVFMLKPL